MRLRATRLVSAAHGIRAPIPAMSLPFAAAGVVDPRITFTRASGATRTAQNGLLEVVASGVPRIDYDPVTLACKGLLVEEARTNLLLYSQEFDNAYWVKSNTTVVADAVTAPDGALTADKVVASATTSIHGITVPSTSYTSGGAYTMSVFAKAGEYSVFSIIRSGTGGFSARFDLSTGTATDLIGGGKVSATHVGGGWYRCSMSWTSSSSTARTHSIQIENPSGTNSFLGDGTSGIYLWGAQLAAKPFPGSYVPTTTAAATKAADVAVMSGSNFSDWYNQAGGTIVVDGLTAGSGTHPSSYFCSINAGSSSNQIGVHQTNDGVVGFSVTAAGALQVALTVAGTLGSRVRIAASFANGAFALSVNGSAVVTAASGSLPAVNQLQIGHAYGTRWINGPIREISYHPPGAVTNAQLQALSRIPS